MEVPKSKRTRPRKATLSFSMGVVKWTGHFYTSDRQLPLNLTYQIFLITKKPNQNCDITLAEILSEKDVI